ncbi:MULTISPECIES: glycosyltransferase [unclassified Arthrobacter]|uniref:glycosyltransferase n=1 Tax=unclassified Arthrobacter TaxID=235627 RepID=UPI001D15B69E|nr:MULTISPECIES: glycosyltransferase [unclassified Arthrobacter]MCC3276935.1 glycosyltransferase [Arthrobacter sp. zg-Y20]MCC3277632.1 glycosyltransferase [Arthrobacter sp. zg-Y40]MCC9179111.1 glycosyltransferase [Arthrobacter sp. zg-Y750]MDK1317096.1 glycosyltransferase [Arthrobacter sp. zg.Y20]MDK1327272.1 glycosyltransferase [Arthrobacter sp. zg-Y1143]
MPDSVAVAAVTFDRPDDVKTLLGALAAQTANITSVALVDSGKSPVAEIAESSAAPVNYIRSNTNLGGAGGFSLAILSAMASGAEWIWIMDDDAHPEDPQCLAVLLAAAQERGLDVVLPLVVAPGAPDTLSFHFRLDGKLTHDRAAVAARGFLPNVGHFFNGALIRADVFYRVGLPDLRLFIRGDETDFMIRLRRAGVAFGTVTTAALTHPAAWSEVQPVLGDRMHVLVPDTPFKQFYFYRNRGHLTRRYGRVKSFVADAAGYPIHFARTKDPKGFVRWLRAYAAGMSGRRFGPPSDFGF